MAAIHRVFHLTRFQVSVQRRKGYSILYLQACQDLCLTHGTAAGKYAGRLLKANCAALPKGCSACFVPQTHYEMQINRDFTLSPLFSCRSLQERAPDGRAQKSPAQCAELQFVCGERGIRTPGPVKINGFQDRRIRPLCHLSNVLPNSGIRFPNHGFP